MKKNNASNLREVSYRQASPFPAQPPRRLTKEQKSEANALRVGALVCFWVGFLISFASGMSGPWAHIWPDYWHIVVLLGALIFGSVFLFAWSTRRIWRDESLGGGE